MKTFLHENSSQCQNCLQSELHSHADKRPRGLEHSRQGLPPLRQDGDVSGPVQEEASGRDFDDVSILIRLPTPTRNWIYPFLPCQPGPIPLHSGFHLLTFASPPESLLLNDTILNDSGQPFLSTQLL